jgi:RHS repeat-associated protein
LFTGREWLGQAGIYDYRNRVYSPQIGRFLQTDPIRFAAGDVNIYRYVFNNAVNWGDPYGLCEEGFDPLEFLNTILRGLAGETPAGPALDVLDYGEALGKAAVTGDVISKNSDLKNSLNDFQPTDSTDNIENSRQALDKSGETAQRVNDISMSPF